MKNITNYIFENSSSEKLYYGLLGCETLSDFIDVLESIGYVDPQKHTEKLKEIIDRFVKNSGYVEGDKFSFVTNNTRRISFWKLMKKDLKDRYELKTSKDIVDEFNKVRNEVRKQDIVVFDEVENMEDFDVENESLVIFTYDNKFYVRTHVYDENTYESNTIYYKVEIIKQKD